MSKRRILDIASVKKRDVMAPNNNYPATPDAVGPFLKQGGSGYTMILWCATAREMREVFSNDKAVVESGRTAQTCMIKGVSESITISTNNSEASRWRRIVFTFKGDLPLGEQFEGDRTVSTTTAADGRVTYYRTNAPLPADSTNSLQNFIFRGQGPALGDAAIDWVDIHSAPLDTSRITKYYDKNINIRSGNDSGIVKTYKFWHEFNKNINYNDEEIGNQVLSTYKSTQGKPGMGDVYILDILTTNSTVTSDLVSFLPNATLYWHER